MKKLKTVFYTVCGLLLLLCGGVMVFAFNPELTQQLADALYGEDRKQYEAPVLAGPTYEPTAGLEDLLTQGPKESPIGLPTPTPAPEIDMSDNGAGIFVIARNNGDVYAKYNVPGSDLVKIPENVEGLVGHIPVTLTSTTVERPITPTQEPSATAGTDSTTSGGDAAQPTSTPSPTPTVVPTAVPDNDATQVVSVGETGEDLNFDTRFYPYYGMLESSAKDIYKQVYANMVAKNTTFAPVNIVTPSALKNVYEAVICDHPELFYVDTAFSCNAYEDGQVVDITLSYNELAGTYDAAKKALEKAANKIIVDAIELEDNYAKARFVHDKLIETCEYSEGAAASQSAYSALVNGQAVCAGYARGYQYVLQQLGIPCYYVSGYSGEDHGWNIVNLYGEYYNVDVTWDDPRKDKDKDKNKDATSESDYTYFCRSDADLAKTHIRKSLSIYLSGCNSTLYRGLEDKELPEDASVLAGGEAYASASEGLQKYYDKCYTRITEMGVGSKTYEEIVTASVWREIYSAYYNGTISDAFLTRALNAAGGTVATLKIEGELQGDGTYKLTHEINVMK